MSFCKSNTGKENVAPLQFRTERQGQVLSPFSIVYLTWVLLSLKLSKLGQPIECFTGCLTFQKRLGEKLG